MSKRDTLKTAKMVIEAIDMACDGHQDRDVKKAKAKERQKGKQVIREELRDYVVVAKPSKPSFSKAMIAKMMKNGKS